MRTDTLRNLFYAAFPLLVIGSVWAIGWSASVQARAASLQNDCEGKVPAAVSQVDSADPAPRR